MKFFKYLFSILFSIIVWGLVIGFIAFLSARSLLNGKSVSKMIKSIEINELFVDKDGNYNEAGRKIKEELTKDGIPEELVDEFLDAEPIVNFVADYAEDTIDYIVNDSQLDKISAKDISKLINDNIDDIFTDLKDRKVEGYELLTDDALNEVKANVDSFAETLEKSLPDIKEELKIEEGQRALDVFRFVISDVVVYIFISIIVFFSLLILLMNLNKCRFGYWLGITYMLAALPFVLLSPLTTTITINSDVKFAKDIVRFILNRFVIYGLIFFGIGLLLLILGIIMGIYKSKKNKHIEKNNYPKEPPVISEEVMSEPVVENHVQETVLIPEKEELPNVEEQPIVDNLYCANCGAKLELNQKFCYNCGTSKE